MSLFNKHNSEQKNKVLPPLTSDGLPPTSETQLFAGNELPIDSNKDAVRVLIIDDSESLVNLITLLLTRVGYSVRAAFTGSDGLTLARRWHPDVILLDVMIPAIDGCQLCRLLREDGSTAGLRIIMVSALATVEQKIVAFEAGANDYVVKPFNSDELLARIEVQVRERDQQKHKGNKRNGKVVTFFSLTGGAGKSSVAINIAASLAGNTALAQSALIDTAFVSGQIGVMLNLSNGLTWGELAKEDRTQITPLLLGGYFLSAHNPNMRVLVAPSHPQDADRIDADLAYTVFTFSQQHYVFTFIDTSPSFDLITLTALDIADLIILVLTPTVPGVAAAAKAWKVFRELGYSENQILVLNNYAHSGDHIPSDMIAKTLEHNIDFTLLRESKNYTTAINQGVPYISLYPKSPLTQDFFRLSDLIRTRIASTDETIQAENSNDKMPQSFVKANKLSLNVI